MIDTAAWGLISSSAAQKGGHEDVHLLAIYPLIICSYKPIWMHSLGGGAEVVNDTLMTKFSIMKGFFALIILPFLPQ